MKGIIKTLSKIASAILTSVSVMVMTIGLCTVDIETWSWTPFIVFALAEAWLLYVFMKHEKGGGNNVE